MDNTEGTIEAIFVTGRGSAAMERVEQAEALVGCGFRGDRYCAGTGYWSKVDECQVTFIAAEDLELITAEGKAVDQGQHRRNVVTRGMSLRGLHDRRWQIGEAVFAYDRPRPPCAHVQQLSEAGMTRALAGGRGGICATVEVAGVIRPGDRIKLLGVDLPR